MVLGRSLFIRIFFLPKCYVTGKNRLKLKILSNFKELDFSGLTCINTIKKNILNLYANFIYSLCLNKLIIFNTY